MIFHSECHQTFFFTAVYWHLKTKKVSSFTTMSSKSNIIINFTYGISLPIWFIVIIAFIKNILFYTLFLYIELSYVFSKYRNKRESYYKVLVNETSQFGSFEFPSIFVDLVVYQSIRKFDNKSVNERRRFFSAVSGQKNCNHVLHCTRYICRYKKEIFLFA